MADYIEKQNRFVESLFPEPITELKQGKGVVNSLINHMPFQLHPMDYRFLGPGTHLDLNLEKGVAPIDKLDALALNHDKAYATSNDLSKRHEADKILQEGAWNRFLDPKASVKERGMAYLTTNAMKAKRFLGAGVKNKNKIRSSNYTKYPVMLDDEEQQMIFHSKKPLKLKLGYERFLRTKVSVMSETFLPVTSYQMKKIKSAIHNKKSVEIKLSMKQINFICKNNKVGGFLPAIAAALPAIAAVGSLISSAVNSYNNKKANDKLVQERIRHNKVMENNSKIINNSKGVTGNGLFEQLMKKSKKKKSLL